MFWSDNPLVIQIKYQWKESIDRLHDVTNFSKLWVTDLILILKYVISSQLQK